MEAPESKSSEVSAPASTPPVEQKPTCTERCNDTFHKFMEKYHTKYSPIITFLVILTMVYDDAYPVEFAYVVNPIAVLVTIMLVIEAIWVLRNTGFIQSACIVIESWMSAAWLKFVFNVKKMQDSWPGKIALMTGLFNASFFAYFIYVNVQLMTFFYATFDFVYAMWVHLQNPVEFAKLYSEWVKGTFLFAFVRSGKTYVHEVVDECRKGNAWILLKVAGVIFACAVIAAIAYWIANIQFNLYWKAFTDCVKNQLKHCRLRTERVPKKETDVQNSNNAENALGSKESESKDNTAPFTPSGAWAQAPGPLSFRGTVAKSGFVTLNAPSTPRSRSPTGSDTESSLLPRKRRGKTG